jgi:hypothetical protein
MAETATRPTRTRAARATKATTPAKATPAKAAKAAAKPATEEDTEVEAYYMDLVQLPDSTRYSKWSPPEGSGCVGTFYAPLGCTEVKVRISAPKS